MKRTLLVGAVLTALMTTTALSDTSSMNTSVTGMGILENDYVRAGVNGTSGTFGSGGGTRPGLQYDSTGSGTFPGDSEQGDYLTPGSPFDGFALKIDGTNSTNNNSGASAWTDSDGLTDGTNTFTWNGTNTAHTGWEIENIYSLGATSEYVDITTNITAGGAADDVYFGRFIDPDAMPESGDTSATDNVLGYSGIPDSNVAFSEATTSRYALGLYSTNSNVDAGISDGWTTNADGYTGSPYTDSDGNSVNYGNGDHTIGLTWHWTGVSLGDILTAEYAYIFGPSAFGAADTAIEGGAGGGTAGETPSDWGDVTDEGSATDAASGPTKIGTATSSVTSHTASETIKIQTIAREKTTSTFDVYSDGTNTLTGTTVETLTPFTGRIDQIASAQDVTSTAVRNLTFDGPKAIGMDSKMSGGLTGTTKGAVLGGSKINNDTGYAIALGAAKLSTSLKGNDDTVTAKTNVLGVNVGKKVTQGDITIGLKHAMTDYDVSRTIGDFANLADTKGTDTSISISFSPTNEKIRPVVGLTKGKNKISGYTETGSVQSLRTVANDTDNYGYATVGLKGDLGPVDFTVMHHTDGVNDIAIGLEKVNENITFSVEANRSMTDLGNTNAISAGIQITW